MIEAVKAKMQVSTIDTTQNQYCTTTKVKLGAVYGTVGENADFAQATPSGECWMQIDTGKPAAQFFKPGKKYYVTFTEAPD